jgi:predicted nuclease with TOPRIM domain
LKCVVTAPDYKNGTNNKQMMACLLAEIRTNQAEMKANREERNTEMKAMQEKTDANLKETTERLEAKIGTSQEKMEHKEEIKPQLRSLASQINAHQEKIKVMLDACLEKMEANPEEIKSEVVYEEVPKELGAVKPVKRTK